MKINAHDKVLSKDAVLTPLYRKIKVRLAASGDVELIKSNLKEIADSDPFIQLKGDRIEIVVALPPSTEYELAYRPRLVIKVKRRSKQSKNIVLDISVFDICSIETNAVLLTCVISSCLRGVINGSPRTLKSSFIFEFLGGPTANGFFFNKEKNEINHSYRIGSDTETWDRQRFTDQSGGLNILVKRRHFDEFAPPRLGTQAQIHATYNGGVEILQFKASDYRPARSIYYADYMSAYIDNVITSKQLRYIQRYGMQRFFWRLHKQRHVDTLDSIWRYVFLLHNLDYTLRLRTELRFLENALSTSYVTMLTEYMRENKIMLSMMLGARKPNLADMLDWARLTTEQKALQD
jgi:hypothetical protein